MKLLKSFLMGLGTVLLLAITLQLAVPKAVHAVVTTLVTIANTSSNPVPVQPVKQSTANFINLTYNVTSQAYDELLPDGTTASFTIPAGQKLVITDISWEAICESNPFGGPTCEKNAGNIVTITFGGNPYEPGGFYISQATYASPYVGLLAGASDHFQSGFVTSQLPAPVLLFGGSPGEGVFSVNLRGYLVPSSAPSE